MRSLNASVGQKSRCNLAQYEQHRQDAARRRHLLRPLAILAAIFIWTGVPGCVRSVSVRVTNDLPIRLLIKRASVPNTVHQTDVVLGWAEPMAVTTLPKGIGLASASYRLCAFAPNGKLIAEIIETQDEVERHLIGNTWEVEIRKPNQAVGKPKHAPN